MIKTVRKSSHIAPKELENIVFQGRFHSHIYSPCICMLFDMHFVLMMSFVQVKNKCPFCCVLFCSVLCKIHVLEPLYIFFVSMHSNFIYVVYSSLWLKLQTVLNKFVMKLHINKNFVWSNKISMLALELLSFFPKTFLALTDKKWCLHTPSSIDCPIEYSVIFQYKTIKFFSDTNDNH